MLYDQLTTNCGALSLVMDRILSAHDSPSPAVNHADWAYNRFVAIQAMIRSRSGGTAPAALARGLLEEAGFWDWAIATGAGDGWLDRLALNEFERLRGRADPNDDIWLRWLLPPGRRIGSASQGVPTTSEVVKRIGHGFTADRLAPLSMTGLFAVYKLIEVVTHGSAATALLFDSNDGCQMSEPLCAAVLHTSGAGAAAVVASQLPLSPEQTIELGAAALSVAHAASAVHGLPMGSARKRSPAKSPARAPQSVESCIDRLPTPGSAIHVAAAAYVDAATAVLHAFRSLGPQPGDPVAILGALTIDLATSHLMILKGIVEGSVGRAYLPVAARALFEDGARWGWLRESVQRAQDGNSIKAMLGEARHHIVSAKAWMSNEGIPPRVADRFLNGVEPILRTEFGGLRLPPITEMISAAYPTPKGRTASALPMYGILSQFVHYSPIATLHLQRDVFPSISAPAFAVAVDAACHGHYLTILGASAVAFDDARRPALPALHELAMALSTVKSIASAAHFLD
jgi:hypothetical protein